MDAISEAGGLLDGEAGDEQRGLEEQLDDGLDGLVVLAISLDLALELLDDGGSWARSRRSSWRTCSCSWRYHGEPGPS